MALSILILKGDPVDLRQYRHTALYLQSKNSSPIQSYHSPASFPPTLSPGGSSTVGRLLQVTGPSREFEFSSQILTSKPTDYHREIPVSITSGSNETILLALIQSTAVNNASEDWDCQSWVRDVLKVLSMARLIESEDYNNTLDALNEVLQEVAVDTL